MCRGRGPLADPLSPGFGEWLEGLQAGFRWLHRPDIISVAAVRGHALAAGFQLALACDLRVLADDALLCMKEPALGLVPDTPPSSTPDSPNSKLRSPGGAGVPCGSDSRPGNRRAAGNLNSII